MARNNKNRAPLMETMEFSNYAQAKDMVKNAENKRIRLLIGLGISAVSTLITLLMVFGTLGNEYIAIPLLLALPAYLIGGGVMSALRTAGRLAKFGWFITRFPYDIVTGFFTFFFSVIAFLFIPFVFVFMNFIQHDRDYKEAKRYLSYYKRETRVRPIEQ